MFRPRFATLLALTVALASVSRVGSSPAVADVLIQPVSVVGSGTFVGSASVLDDGVIPPRFTPAASPTTVSWNSLSTTFTLNLGATYTITNLIASLDNNDDYLIQSSLNGTTFTNLFTFSATDGPVQASQGGLDILTTFANDPTSPTDLTTPAYVGRGFAPVQAAYLRISALSGDSVYAVGELQAFTSSVPEPSSLALATLAGLGLAGLARYRRRHSTRRAV